MRVSPPRHFHVHPRRLSPLPPRHLCCALVHRQEEWPHRAVVGTGAVHAEPPGGDLRVGGHGAADGQDRGEAIPRRAQGQGQGQQGQGQGQGGDDATAPAVQPAELAGEGGRVCTGGEPAGGGGVLAAGAVHDGQREGAAGGGRRVVREGAVQPGRPHQVLQGPAVGHYVQLSPWFSLHLVPLLPSFYLSLVFPTIN